MNAMRWESFTATEEGKAREKREKVPDKKGGRCGGKGVGNGGWWGGGMGKKWGSEDQKVLTDGERENHRKKNTTGDVSIRERKFRNQEGKKGDIWREQGLKMRT